MLKLKPNTTLRSFTCLPACAPLAAAPAAFQEQQFWPPMWLLLLGPAQLRAAGQPTTSTRKNKEIVTYK